MVSEHEVLVNGEREFVADIGHDFRLLHRINAQFALEVLVEFNEISRIPRVFNHNGHDRGRHFSVVNHGRRWGRSGCSRLNRGFSLQRRGFGSRSGGWCRWSHWSAITGHSLDVADHVIEGWIVCQHEILVHGKTEPFTDVRHDFGLFHRINAQFTLEVLIEFNKVRRVASVLDHDLNDRAHQFTVLNHGGGGSGWRRCCWRGRSGR